MVWQILTEVLRAYWEQILRITVLIGLGFPVVVALERLVRRWVGSHFTSHHALIAGKITLYVGILLIVFSVLSVLGFPMTHITGTAGIMGIAIAFASQTSVSNIISGVFLMTEQSFVIGDVIQVAGITGEIMSIDTLSLKLRTFQNQMVRIPNETMIKSEVTNLTRFPIRRIDLEIGVAYKEDLKMVRASLMKVAADNPLCLSEPSPNLILTGFGDSAIEMLFVVWAMTPNWLRVRNELTEAVKSAFDEAGIEIPFPHLSLYRGSASEPFEVRHLSHGRMAEKDPGAAPSESSS